MSGGVALQALIAGLSVGAVYGLVGIGFSLVWALTRVLDFAHGDVVIGAVLLAVLAVIGTTPVALSPDLLHSIALVVLTLVLGVVLSIASYVVAVRPFLDRGHRSADVMGWVAGGVTAGLVIRTAVALALPAAAYAVPDPLHLDRLTASAVVSLPGGGVVAVRAFPVLGIALVVAAVSDRLLVRSRLGRALRAVADDPDAAAGCGVAVERVVLVAFGAAGLLAAVAAVLVAPNGSVSPDSGVVLGLTGAAAALLGRLRSPRDAVVGGLVLGVAQQLMQATPHLGAAWADLLPLLVLVVVLAVRPNGLLSPRDVVAE
jgi:branched-subunit amino acid ABC-type transport system permease component